METLEALKWLKGNDLYSSARNISLNLKKIFTPCLGVTDEQVLIIGDRGYKNKQIASILAGSYYLAAEELNLNAKLLIQDVKSRGSIADSDVIASLHGLKEGSIILVSMSDKLGSIDDLGKSFRKMCKKKKYRFVSALSLGDLQTGKLNHVVDSIDTNYRAIQSKHEQLKNFLDNKKELHVQTKLGTDITIGIDGMPRNSANGNYTEPGTGGNLPAGEIYMPPNGKKVNGSVVIDASSRNHKHTTLIKKPIKLTIEDGSITQIEGDDEALQLKKTLEWAEGVAKYPGSVRRIGEIGIGLNPKAKVIGSTLVDEKALGTAHVGIGSNYWFGGSVYAIIHLDQIFHNPIIKADGEEFKL